MEFSRIGTKLSEDDLRYVEEIVGELPADLRCHYLDTNGGVPAANTFTDDSDAESSIDSFLTVRYPQFAGDVLLEQYYRIMVIDRAEFADSYVPFARDYGDNLWLMDRTTGKIFYWAHDVPGEALRPAADSLASLLSRLQTEDDYFADDNQQ